MRPDLVRRALCWLISNNPNLKENLRALEDTDINYAIPTGHVTHEDVNEL